MGLNDFEHLFIFFLVIWNTNNSVQTRKFLEEPKSVEVYEGSTISLNCIFTEPVSRCFWQRNEITVTIDGRYQYINNNGRNTNDCSIRISKCDAKYDFGTWGCITSDPTQKLASQMARLTVHSKEIAFVHQPIDVSVHLRDIGKIECILRLPVTKCYWKRNGMSVWIDKRYQYLDGNGKDTTICSILITDARPIDNGTWQCAIHEYGNEKVPYLFSREVTFHVKPVSFIKEPNDMTVKNSSRFVLDCVFSHAVSECYWKRNGITVPIGGRYHFLTGNGVDASVCSIWVDDAQLIDNGTWQCAFYGNDNVPGLLSREATITIETNKSSSVSLYDDSYPNYALTFSAVFVLLGSLLTVIANFLYQCWIKKGNRDSISDGSRTSLLQKDNKQQHAIMQLNQGVRGILAIDTTPQQTITWTIENYRLKKKEALNGNNNILSESYCICSNGCRVQFRMLIDALPSLYEDKHSMGLFFKFLPDKRGYIRDHVLDHEISFTVKNLRGDMSISQIKQPAYGKQRQEHWKSGWNGNCIFAAQALFKENGNYLDKESLKIEVSIRNLVPLFEEAASYDGILVWHIEEYSKKKEQEKEGLFEKLVSESFYTSERGYRMRAFLYLNGSYRSGTHMELQLKTYRGKHDPELPRAFGHVRNITIMPAKDSNSKPIIQTTTTDPTVLGDDEVENQMGNSRKALVVKHSMVENADYIQADTLHIKIEIISLSDVMFQTSIDV